MLDEAHLQQLQEDHPDLRAKLFMGFLFKLSARLRQADFKTGFFARH